MYLLKAAGIFLIIHIDNSHTW